MTPNRTGSTGGVRNSRNALAVLELRQPMPETAYASAAWHERHLPLVLRARAAAGQPPYSEAELTALWTIYRLGWSDARDFGMSIVGRDVRARMYESAEGGR